MKTGEDSTLPLCPDSCRGEAVELIYHTSDCFMNGGCLKLLLLWVLFSSAVFFYYEQAGYSDTLLNNLHYSIGCCLIPQTELTQLDSNELFTEARQNLDEILERKKNM